MSPFWGGLGGGDGRQENQDMTAGCVLQGAPGTGDPGTGSVPRKRGGGNHARGLQAITVPDPWGTQGRIRGRLECKAVRKRSPGGTHTKAMLSTHLIHCLTLQP